MNRIIDYSKLADGITNWIRDYATTNNIKSLVVGVSGGVDSAVISTLCARTGLPTYCIVLDIHSKEEHLNTAEDHLVWLTGKYINASGSTRDLSECYRSFIFSMGQSYEDTELGCANTKSRFRMASLYYVAHATNGIVVGTGNKVEDFGVGFYTKYGDGGVDISPIADLYKTEVRELGRYLGISQEILDAVPTDGLWSDGRTDEQQLGCTYEELEWVMEEYLSDPHDDVYYTPRQMEIVAIYNKLHKQNQHKILPIPIYKLNQ